MPNSAINIIKRPIRIVLHVLIGGFFYPLGIRLYGLGLWLAQWFNPKARAWVDGRDDWETQLLDFARRNDKPVVWLHAASLGEFEQARPVLKLLRRRHPDFAYVVTFYSPSGYEVRKNTDEADWVSYLPLDTRRNARLWLRQLRPQLILWVRYDFWGSMLLRARRHHIPVVLFSAVFRDDQRFFHWTGTWWRKVLNSFAHIFVQNQTSLDLLKQVRMNRASLAYDTRFDRVWQAAQISEALPRIEAFKAGKKLLVAGSTWPRDEELLLELMNDEARTAGWKLVIVPHEVGDRRIDHLCAQIQRPFRRISKIIDEPLDEIDILVVDDIGYLAQIYRYGNTAYLGGGFGAGVHSVAEAMVFGLPVIVGPNYRKSVEAVEAERYGGLISVRDLGELRGAFEQFKALDNKPENRQYIEERQGSSRKIVEFIEAHDLLHQKTRF